MKLNRIYRDAQRFGLSAEFINDTTLKIYSEKYFFDTWLVVDMGNKIQLLHQSKKGSTRNKCNYHLQREVKSHNWKWIIQNINNHNDYVINHRGNKRMNMVDRVLGEYNRNRYAN